MIGTFDLRLAWYWVSFSLAVLQTHTCIGYIIMRSAIYEERSVMCGSCSVFQEEWTAITLEPCLDWCVLAVKACGPLYS